MKHLLSVFSLILLVSCGTTKKEIVLPDGSIGYAIKCDGMYNDITGCYELAGQACPGGYIINGRDREVTNSSVATGSANYNHYYGGSAAYTAINSTEVKRSMIVKCKEGQISRTIASTKEKSSPVEFFEKKNTSVPDRYQGMSLYTRGNVKGSIKYFYKSCKNKDSESCYMLSVIYSDMNQDRAALEYLQYSLENGKTVEKIMKDNKAKKLKQIVGFSKIIREHRVPASVSEE